MTDGAATTNEGEVRASFASQAESCRGLGSPFTALFCATMAERLDRRFAFGRRVLDWPGNPRADALALRCAGAFNALARSGRAPALTALYPPVEPSADTLWNGILAALAGHDAFLTGYLDSPPQTNEVKRCAVLLGGALMVARQTGLPLDLIEIGASAGLNLGFDLYRYEMGGCVWGTPTAPVTIRSEWRGALPPLDAPLAIATRRACDLNPLDPGDPEHRARVMSYIWPDQSDRIATTEAAFDAAARQSWRVEQADAAEWIEARLAVPQAHGQARLMMHTIMWQYLPEAAKRRIEQAMAQAAAAATPEAPLAWLRMEADGQPGSAAVTLAIWPQASSHAGGEREIARADYHGRWVEWR
ncbi:MAG TPA: DUF2332 family protein [Bosea sp. (in: a-proteobacteria)]|jgi:hypothetical protein|uniref:DUF2332 domain-containing protein n=1 Tax=Bosea sp. (in: a-proteobacteria) TaxID=1871050 RepID=UPI002E1015EE|nr:DUF2332 family protein [Bosea sp. (in: a-proteobacteria)]